MVRLCSRGLPGGGYFVPHNPALNNNYVYLVAPVNLGNINSSYNLESFTIRLNFNYFVINVGSLYDIFILLVYYAKRK